MKLQKLLCIGFDGSELDKVQWQELLTLADSCMCIPADMSIVDHTDADGLWVRLGATVDKTVIDQFANLK